MTMNKLALATLVAMGMSAAAIAQQPAGQSDQRSTQPSQQTREAAPAPRGGDRTEQATFERADKNADGRISREEGNDIDGFDFSRADTNNDASLSRQEYQAAMATSTPRDGAAARNDSGSARSGDASPSSRSAQSGAGAAGGASARSESAQSERAGDARDRDARDRDADDRRGNQSQQGQRSAQLSFDTVDKDKDGKVTRAEAEDVDGLNFSSADTNADASLSRQEFQVAMAGAQPRG